MDKDIAARIQADVNKYWDEDDGPEAPEPEPAPAKASDYSFVDAMIAEVDEPLVIGKDPEEHDELIGDEFKQQIRKPKETDEEEEDY